MAGTNFVSYANATELMASIAAKLKSQTGAYKIRGTSTFANLPSVLTESMNGYVYNVTDAFTTDARFIEGAGKKYPAGTDVVIIDNSSYAAVTPVGSENPLTEGWYEIVSGEYIATTDTAVDPNKTYYAKTVDMRYNVGVGFIDVDGIEAEIASVRDMITDEFDATKPYAVGDVVIYQGVLYKFTSPHTAGAWAPAEVTSTTVADLIADAEPDSLTTAQVNALIALLS